MAKSRRSNAPKSNGAKQYIQSFVRRTLHKSVIPTIPYVRRSTRIRPRKVNWNRIFRGVPPANVYASLSDAKGISISQLRTRLICGRRQARKEVLHAIGIAGRKGGSGAGRKAPGPRC